MSFQDFWKKTKKALAIQVEAIKNIPTADSDMSSPLNSAEYIETTQKLKRLINLINQTISNFQQLNQCIATFSSKQRICWETFSLENPTKVDMESYKNKSISFEQTIMSTIVEDIKNNKDLAFLYSKLPELNNLNHIHDKLYNNLLLKKRAEDKVESLMQHGTPEQRQTASAEYDKRSEKSAKYQNDLDEGIERIAIEVISSLKSLEVFYRSELQKFVETASKTFIYETVPVEAFMGSHSSDEEREMNARNKKETDDKSKEEKNSEDDEKSGDSD